MILLGEGYMEVRTLLWCLLEISIKKCFKGVRSLLPGVGLGHLSWADCWELISVQSPPPPQLL